MPQAEAWGWWGLINYFFCALHVPFPATDSYVPAPEVCEKWPETDPTLNNGVVTRPKTSPDGEKLPSTLPTPKRHK
jgi:hypothetical protein